MDTIIIDEATDFDPATMSRLRQLLEAEKAIRRESVMIAQFVPYNGAQAEIFELDGKELKTGDQVLVSFGYQNSRNGIYIVGNIRDETPKCTVVEPQDDPKLRALYAQLSRAKMQRNKHLITDLEKRIKNYVRY